MHGRELYQVTKRHIRSGNWDDARVMGEIRPRERLGLEVDQAAAQREAGQVGPAIVFFFPHEGEFSDRDATATLVFCPTVPRQNVSALRLLLGAHLKDSEMGHVRPLLLGSQSLRVQTIMQLTHTVRRVRNANKYGGGYGHERFCFAEDDFKGIHTAANVFQSFQSREFTALKATWRQDGEMRRQVREIRVKLLPKPLDKLPNGVFHISHQGVARSLHLSPKLYLLLGARSALQRRFSVQNCVSLGEGNCFRDEGSCAAASGIVLRL